MPALHTAGTCMLQCSSSTTTVKIAACATIYETSPLCAIKLASAEAVVYDEQKEVLNRGA
eukprot:5140-Heterococcus_DN1.PRE.2